MNDKRGFTLVELITVIVVISIVMMIVIPSVSRIQEENRVQMLENYKKMMVEYAKANNKDHKWRIYLYEMDGLENAMENCNGYVTMDYSTDPPTYYPELLCNWDEFDNSVN